MFNPKTSLDESKKFVTRNQQVQAEFAIESQQQQAKMSELTMSGIARVRARQEQQRRAELTSAFDSFREGADGLMQNFSNISSFSSASNSAKHTFELQNGEYQAHETGSFVTAVASSSQSIPPKNVPKEKIIELMLQDDKELQVLDDKIKILQQQKQNMRLEDGSQKAYASWCQAEVNSVLIAAGECDLISEMKKAKASLKPYEDWSSLVELRNEKKMSAVEGQIAAAKRLYASEKSARREAIGNYELSRQIYEKKMLNSNITLEQFNMYMKRFPTPLEFDIATAKKYSVSQAKLIEHPQAAGLVALLNNGSNATDESWRNVQNFYANPLPVECFNSNIAVSSDLGLRIQQQSEIQDNFALKMLVKSGKTFWNSVLKTDGPKQFLVKIGGTLFFEGLDVCIGENDPDGTKMNVLREHLDTSLDVVKQIIPRVAGADEQKLKSMYLALNATLTAVVDDPNTSSQVKRLLQEKIESNSNAMMYQRQEICDYLSERRLDANQINFKNREF